MRHSASPTRLTMLLMLAGAAAAQSSGGPTMALAQGFSVDTSIGPYSSGSVILNDTDFDANLPPMTWVPGAPDFTLLWFAGCDVDALSLGMDWVLSNAAGVVTIPAGQWGVLTYSVRTTTVGLPGSVIANEVAAPDGAASDIFAYVLPGSALPPALVGVPFRAQDSTEIATPPGSNVDAHDLFIGLLYRDNPQLAALLPPPTVFFSVTDATKGLIPVGPGPSDWTTMPALASGATVFSTTWQPASWSWSTPVVALTPASLGLFASEDLDGLALDLAHSRVLLSTDLALPPPLPTPPRNPLLYSNLFSGMNTTYRLQSGGPVSAAIGLAPGGADDADGLCMLDPGTAAAPSQQRIDRMIGTPRNAIIVPGMPTTLQMSVTRHGVQGTSQEFFRTFMTGWPYPGPMQSGLAFVGVTIGPPASGPWVTLGFVSRPDPLSQYFTFQGHPERYDWQIPYGFSLSNIPVSFVWGAMSYAGFAAMSYPATITL